MSGQSIPPRAGHRKGIMSRIGIMDEYAQLDYEVREVKHESRDFMRDLVVVAGEISKQLLADGS